MEAIDRDGCESQGDDQFGYINTIDFVLKKQILVSWEKQRRLWKIRTCSLRY